MRLNVGIVSDFLQLLRDLDDPYDIAERRQAYGLAITELDRAFIFVDRLAKVISRPEWWEYCLFCDNRHGHGCDFEELDITNLMTEISRATIHELEHLCGCGEEQIIELPEHNICPLYECPLKRSVDQ